MITKSELFRKANEWGIPLAIVEKDYVLGWLLAAIGQFPAYEKVWCFKGGTCLKKCYFRNYRFSEDLDFSILDDQQMDIELLTRQFIEIAQWVYKQSGILIPESSIQFEVHQNTEKGKSIQGRLKFIGPLRPKTNFPRIKLDLTSQEKIVSPPEKKEIFHDYQEALTNQWIYAYDFEEVFSEKLCALFQRARPRDLYDVVHLYEFNLERLDKAKFLHAVGEKFSHIGIPFPNLGQMDRELDLDFLKSGWESMLRHQLPVLPSVEGYIERLHEALVQLFPSEVGTTS